MYDDDLDSPEDDISSLFDLFGIGYLPKNAQCVRKERREHTGEIRLPHFYDKI